MFLPSTITLKPGDSGDFVAELQRRLSAISLFDEAAVSGFYDGPTTASVKSFQTSHGISPDGVAGPETIRRLNGALSGTSDATSSDESSGDEEEKEAERLTLKDGIANPLNQEAAIAPMLMESASAAPAEVAAEPAPQIAEQDALAQREAQSKAAETAQANIAQQSQLQDMLMQALQNKQTPQQQQTEAPSAAGTEQAKQAETQVLKEQLAQPKPAPEATQQAAQNTQDAALQKEQLAQQAPKAEAEVEKQIVEKPARTPLIQKLVDYVESHLPTETVREVLQVGSNMLRAGVKQAAMPDDAGARAPEAAQARGQEQAAQRGA